MLKCFNTLIRPTLEYAAPTFHPMLTGEMEEEIERIQKRACRIIFGWEKEYGDLVSTGVVETLKTRRENLTLRFAETASKSSRFGKWFPKKEEGNMRLRQPLVYEELFARTERLKKSPLFYMRRLLNE